MALQKRSECQKWGLLFVSQFSFRPKNIVISKKRSSFPIEYIIPAFVLKQWFSTGGPQSDFRGFMSLLAQDESNQLQQNRRTLRMV